ncbi:hypothetical protein CTAYLR_003991 [Chrysophaeum taylorii]|uniref:CS domain-containing protein n=1 Tax=Chrysophaeum taylorii TaxID=2483200 RepID=A0AAD7XHQ9_9STRA|nr:hypothetical protein CTAYLR_003991 [Chrysophaeum taylorii]
MSSIYVVVLRCVFCCQVVVRSNLALACEERADAAGVMAAFRRGDYACAVETAKLSSGRAENAVALEFRAVEKAMKEIKEALKPAPKSAVVPAYQWAQSGREVFVSVKFAHKLDAPATLVNGGDFEVVDFQNRSVTVRAAKASKKFVLELGLLRDIDPLNCSWSSASVGRATLTLRKAAEFAEWWPRLLATKSKPSNQHVWWDKQDGFENEREEVEKQEKDRAKAAKRNKKNLTETTVDAATPETEGEEVNATSGGVEAPSDEEVAGQKALAKKRSEIRKSGQRRDEAPHRRNRRRP